MGDDQDSEVLAKGFNGLHYCLFGFVVEGAGGFIEDYYVGLFIEGPGYAYSLALTSGEADASFADVGFVFFWPGFDDVGYLGLSGSLFNSLAIDFIFGHPKGYVFFDGTISKKYSLGNMGNMGLPCPVVVPDDQDARLGDGIVPKPEPNVQERPDIMILFHFFLLRSFHDGI